MPITFTYQWRRDAAGNGTYSDIGGAASSTYVLQAADIGCHVRCRVTATDVGSNSADSNTTGLVGPLYQVSPAAGLVLGGSVTSTRTLALSRTGGVVIGGRRSYGAWPVADNGLSGALGANWTTPAFDCASPARIRHSSMYGQDATVWNDSGGAWNGQTGNDWEMWVECGMSIWGDALGNGKWYKLWWSTDKTATSGYYLQIIQNTGYVDLILRRNPGAFQIAWDTLSITLQPGDRIGIRKSGSTFSFWHKPAAGSWEQAGTSHTDATYNQGGYFGVTQIDGHRPINIFGGGTIGGSPGAFPVTFQLDTFDRGAPSGVWLDYVTDIVISGETLKNIGDSFAIWLRNCTNVTIVDVDLVNCISGIRLENCSGTLRIGSVRGGYQSGELSNFIQLRDSTMQGIIEGCDYIGGHTEDVIGLKNSGGVDAGHPIYVQDNRITGTNWTSLSGSGLNLGEDGGGYIVARRNKLHTPGQVGIGVSGGHDITIDANVIYATPNRSFTTYGISVANWTSTPSPSGIAVTNNRVHWVDRDGNAGDYWDRGDMGAVTLTGNTFADGTIVPESLLAQLLGPFEYVMTMAASPSGGLRLGGSMVAIGVTPGGLLLGGSITQTRVVTLAPSKGLALGGSVAVTRTTAYSCGGGLQLGGATAPSISFAYQWQRDFQGNDVFTDIVGAVGQTRVLQSGDVSCNLRCKVTATLNGSTTATSNTIGPVGPAAQLTVFGGLVLGGQVPRQTHTAAANLIYMYGDSPLAAEYPSGGIMLGGQASVRIFRGTGGIILMGGVVLLSHSVRYNPSGSLCLGGMALGNVYANAPPTPVSRTGMAAVLGAASEASWGNYSHPTYWYLFNSEKLVCAKARVVNSAVLNGKRVLQSNRWQSGPKAVRGEVSLPVSVAGFALLFKHMLGAVITSPDGPGWHHRFSVASLNGLGMTWQVKRPSTNGTDSCFTYTGGKVTKWQLSHKLNAQLQLQLGLDFKDEDVNRVLFLPTMPSNTVLFGPETLTVAVAGAPFDATDFQLSSDVALKVDRYMLAGGGVKSEQLETDNRVFSGNLSGEFWDMSQYFNFLAADPSNQASLVPITLTWTSKATYGAGRPFRLVITLPTVRADGNTPTVDGPDVLSGSWDFSVLAGATEPITIDYYTSDP